MPPDETIFPVSTKAHADLYRMLPGIDELLRHPALVTEVARHGQAIVVVAARSVLDQLRAAITTGTLDERSMPAVLDGIPPAISREIAKRLAVSLRPVINASGVILHTNLGRAPLSAAALDHVREVSSTYSNLEFNLDTGERSKRDVHADRLFARLLSAGREVASVVVNNNAAAVMLALNSLAEGGEVIVSRGELVEIGGSFRIPDVMSKSQAILREVGTTNRTRISDYKKAINDRTRLLLRVHRSNFQIVGFTEQPSLEDLVKLGRERGIPVMEDLGSGAFFDLGRVGVEGEPTVSRSLRAGVDIVTYSGDKLLGGPQAGIISGDPALVARIRSNPMFRALRVDKMIYAALEATLLAYVREDYGSIPALQFLRVSPEELRARAIALKQQLESAGGISVDAVPCATAIGGGAAPGATVPSFALSVEVAGKSADGLASELRRGDPPIVGRIEEDRLLLDLRTVWPGQDRQVAEAILGLSRK